jgi:oligopeptide/dipeptide ABC transporter ATP-binding protein
MVATNDAQTEELVQIRDLETYFEVGTKGIVLGIMADRKTVRAVDGVSLTIRQGETLGLVGESGCGKSTLGYNLVQLERPTGGQILFEGNDMSGVSRGELQRIRRRMQIIFQDPQSALDARMTIGDAIAEPIRVHEIVPEDEIEDRVADLLATVGLNPYMRNRYPHEFSGGQLQRIVIARALSLEPIFIVCDEPISALDVSIQAQIINLLEELQDRFGLTYLFISHDLRVVRHISDRVAVMYLGKLVEFSETDELYDNPLHPYTRALLSSVPAGDPAEARGKVRIALEGDVPSPIDPPSGCRFRTRCPIAIPSCADEVPPLREVADGHWVACQLV